MNKTASERPLCDPGGSDGGGMCVCVCVNPSFLVLFSTPFSSFADENEL